MYLFGKDKKGWYIAHNGKYQYSIKKPAICLSYHPDRGPIRGTLLKFGSSGEVRTYFENTARKYADAGLTKEASELVYMDFEDTYDVKDLNKCIEVPGYVALLYERSVDDGMDREGISI